jgi:hypothetical protein
LCGRLRRLRARDAGQEHQNDHDPCHRAIMPRVTMRRADTYG